MNYLAALFCSLVLAGSALAGEGATFAVSGFTFTRPEGWKGVEPSSPMRKAQLEVPGKDGGKSADVVFYDFGAGQGGTVEENVSRWFKQFSGGAAVQKTEKLDVAGAKVTVVSTEGTMKASPFAGVPEDQAGFALLGAIFEKGDHLVFIKMTGPAELVKASRDPFLALVKSATAGK